MLSSALAAVVPSKVEDAAVLAGAEAVVGGDGHAISSLLKPHDFCRSPSPSSNSSSTTREAASSFIRGGLSS